MDAFPVARSDPNRKSFRGEPWIDNRDRFATSTDLISVHYDVLRAVNLPPSPAAVPAAKTELQSSRDVRARSSCMPEAKQKMREAVEVLCAELLRCAVYLGSSRLLVRERC